MASDDKMENIVDKALFFVILLTLAALSVAVVCVAYKFIAWCL